MKKALLVKSMTNSAPCLYEGHDSCAAYTTHPGTRRRNTREPSAKGPFADLHRAPCCPEADYPVFCTSIVCYMEFCTSNYNTFREFVKGDCEKKDNNFFAPCDKIRSFARGWENGSLRRCAGVVCNDKIGKIPCHSEPVTDVTGVRIRDTRRRRERIATPACGLVRNDRIGKFFRHSEPVTDVTGVRIRNAPGRTGSSAPTGAGQ